MVLRKFKAVNNFKLIDIKNSMSSTRLPSLDMKSANLQQQRNENKLGTKARATVIIRGTSLARELTSPNESPRLVGGLFGIRLLILQFNFQFSKSIKSSTFHIFLNLTYPLRKNISFPKHPKITQKFTQNRQIVVNEISGGI